MSELRDRLNKVIDRIEDLENNRSELARDMVLAGLRDLYDEAKFMPLKPNEQSAPKDAVSVVSDNEEGEIKDELKEEETIIEKTKPVLQSTPLKPQEPEEKIVIPDPPVFDEVDDSLLAVRRSLIAEAGDDEKPNDDKTLAGQLGKKPLEDLRTGIPLNEKFGIIRGLFGGNASDFGDAVLKLNNAKSGQEINQYLDLLVQRFGWDVESEVYHTFSAYVERKMLTLETSDANADQ